MAYNKPSFNPIILIALACVAGVIVFWKQIQALLSPVQKAGEQLGNIVDTTGTGINDVLLNAGIGKSEADKKIEQQATIKSCWTPAFYKEAPTGAHLLTAADQESIARQIEDSLGFFSDNFEQCYAAFQRCRYKSQISILSERFNTLFQKDLLAFISPSSFNFDFQNRFTESESNKILNYVASLPNY